MADKAPQTIDLDDVMIDKHWCYTKEANGYFEVRAGGLGVGQLIFEDHAQILVDALNAKEPEWQARHRGKKAHA